MASNIVKYRSRLDIYQIIVHIQCQIRCEQCTSEYIIYMFSQPAIFYIITVFENDTLELRISSLYSTLTTAPLHLSYVEDY